MTHFGMWNLFFLSIKNCSQNEGKEEEEAYEHVEQQLKTLLDSTFFVG